MECEERLIIRTAVFRMVVRGRSAAPEFSNHNAEWARRGAIEPDTTSNQQDSSSADESPDIHLVVQQ